MCKNLRISKNYGYMQNVKMCKMWKCAKYAKHAEHENIQKQDCAKLVKHADMIFLDFSDIF